MCRPAGPLRARPGRTYNGEDQRPWWCSAWTRTSGPTHTTVATDELGRQQDQRTLPATDTGHQRLLAWARENYPGPAEQRLWAIEDCRHVSGRLERALLAAGERVVRVPSHLTAQARRDARTRGKSDSIDALAVARAALREPDLPVARHDQASRELKLLVDHRDQLVTRRTEIINRLRWRLHELDPELVVPDRTLHRTGTQKRLIAALGTAQHVNAAAAAGLELQRQLALDELDEVVQLTHRADELEKQISARSRDQAAELLAIPGCGALTAAKLIAETADVRRFRSEDGFAAHAGTAPIPVSSGNRQRLRLCRGGNRQLNLALHRIALTQIRLSGRGRDYYQRKQAEGHTKKEALRALKRKIARAVYTALRLDAARRSTPSSPAVLT
ncbi:MAG TPA: IS110 family transposase, partial [Pseudonocardiaceae bacterium]|nr:IS110 family transposase [Pseudonocardiaceae bacterium]